jgi:hypothetical protein
MTSRGRRIAFLLGLLIAFALPKRVEETRGRCVAYRVEPWGFYLLEQLFGPFGIGYTSGEDCH